MRYTPLLARVCAIGLADGVHSCYAYGQHTCPLMLSGEAKMGKLQTVPSPSTALHGQHLPPLEAGAHLDQATFQARYEAMPSNFRAELIGGVVFVPSPLRLEHAG